MKLFYIDKKYIVGVVSSCIFFSSLATLPVSACSWSVSWVVEEQLVDKSVSVVSAYVRFLESDGYYISRLDDIYELDISNDSEGMPSYATIYLSIDKVWKGKKNIQIIDIFEHQEFDAQSIESNRKYIFYICKDSKFKKLGNEYFACAIRDFNEYNEMYLVNIMAYVNGSKRYRDKVVANAKSIDCYDLLQD